MVEIVKKLAKLVKIKDLFFESVDAQRLLFGAPPKEVEIDLSYSAEGALRGQGMIDAVMSFFVKINGLEKATVAKIACKVRVVYQYDTAGARDLKIDNDAVTAFASTNGIYNAYPYFR